MGSIKYFVLQDRLVAYNPNTMEIFCFKGNAKQTIPKVLPEDYSEADKKKFIEEISKIEDEPFRKYMLGMVEEYEMNFTGDREIMTVSFAPVHKCNMRCKYCFAEGGNNYKEEIKEMNEEMLRKIFSFVLDYYAPKCKFILVSLVSGGEPFLNTKLIVKINDILDSLRPGIGRKIFVGTNLTLYNDEIGEDLKNCNPQLGVSIDGPREFHNANRVFADGNGTYEIVRDNLSKLKSDKTLSQKTRNCIFMTVLTEDNLNLVEIIKHHKELGATSVQMRVARSRLGENQGINEENLERYIAAYEELTNFFLDEFRECRTDYLNMIINSSDYFGKYIKRLILKEFSQYRCGAAKDKLTFTANGDIYPCDSFVGTDLFLLGNVADKQGLRNGFEQYTLFANEKCNSCWAKYICTGDCPFNSFARTGKIDEPDDLMCRFYQKLSELAIRLICDMALIDINRFQRLKKGIEIREKNNNIS